MTPSPAANVPLLQARGLSFARNDEPVFGPLDFRLAPGEALLVLGGNGAGKTTLLRVLIGLLRADDGSVDIDGERHAFQTVISRNTMIFDVTGLPALMLPSGVGSTGLPTGIQIVGRPGADALCLKLGRAFQQVTDFHRMMPPEDAV